METPALKKQTTLEGALRVLLIHRSDHTIGKININLPLHTKIQVRLSRFNFLHKDFPSILVQIMLAFLYLSSPISSTYMITS